MNRPKDFFRRSPLLATSRSVSSSLIPGASDQPPSSGLVRLDARADALGVSAARLRRYRAVMVKVARRGLADENHVDDVVHNAFVVAYQKEKSERPPVEDERGWLAWLCGIVRVLVLEYRRGHREMPTEPEDLANLLSTDTDADMRGYEDIASAQAAVDALPSGKRELLDEHFLQEKPIAQIAAERGLPYTTAYSQFNAALSEARSFVDGTERPAKRRRAPVTISALLVFITLVREARARVAAFSTHAFASFARAPMRVLGSFAAGAVLLGSTPASDPQAMPRHVETHARAEATLGRASTYPIDCKSVLLCAPHTESPPPRTNIESRPPRAPGRPRAYKERSMQEVIDANAIRHGEPVTAVRRAMQDGNVE
ncbi:sigma-70 family RNA polymerase sigma factor [Polyangium sp. 15x6]|uniref:RNA polymerase sigma factor n=1 Tax=Polyangium sp. 15x6 TaxID=3042687 RepID=UPI00249BA713|nr:sigma-70 family RNA polymerase sigma factor [Polyangium sp. 15x6]MDI3287918.1 sigma-70 family RNA polymerase sigma factor [Polyangium sp. 15x6]